MTEEQTLIEEIQALNLKREKLKADLRDKVAEQAVQKERWVLYGESTSLAERLSLQADIDVLEADRQRTKVELMLLKQEAFEMRYKNWEQLKSSLGQVKKGCINLEDLISNLFIGGQMTLEVHDKLMYAVESIYENTSEKKCDENV